MLTNIRLENFTAFKNLDVKFSPGINVFIGANGTGKTHIMKAAYAACDISVSGRNFADKLEKVFFPSNHQIGRLARRDKISISSQVVVSRKIKSKSVDLKVSFSNHTTAFEKAEISGLEQWESEKITSVFIPVKDMLANAPGFRSSYNQRELHFEEIYDDITARALLGKLKGPTDKSRKKLLGILEKAIAGKVVIKKEEFFLKNKQGELEFTLLAEGFRKLALLHTLIQNGTLLSGSALFWDEPEANLNPALMEAVVDILLALQRQGVQIFIATHDYVFLKWLSLKIDHKKDKFLYHSLFKNEDGDISRSSTSDYNEISPNAIDAGYEQLSDAEIRREMGVK